MKKIICLMLVILCVLLAGCTENKPKPEEKASSTNSAETNSEAPEKESEPAKPIDAKDVGDMTLNEIASGLSEVPPEKWDELRSSMEADFMKEMESASYREWEFFDPTKTETSSLDWSWDYDPTAETSTEE